MNTVSLCFTHFEWHINSTYKGYRLCKIQGACRPTSKYYFPNTHTKPADSEFAANNFYQLESAQVANTII